jgi:hypothetical protein
VAPERAVGDRSGSPEAEREALRARALADLDALIQISQDARRDIRSYQSALEKNYRHLTRGGRASDMSGLFDVSAVRANFTDRLNSIERARSLSRRSLWRLQVFEGMTIAEIARAWGFSRQLVSRALSARDDSRAGTS